MKKLFTLIAAMTLTATAAHSQRVYDITFEGVTPLSKCGYANPSSSKNGLLEVVFPEGTNLSNIKATFVPSDETTSVTTTPIPTDFTNQQLITVAKDGTTPVNYNVVFRTMKPAALPFSLSFSSTNLPVWTSETLGWAGTCVDATRANVQFGNKNRGFILAFNSAPSTLAYTILASGTWDPSNVFDVEQSADGISWSNVKKYTGDGALTSTSVPELMSLDQATRFIRFNYTSRTGNANVSMNDFVVTKSTGTSLSTEKVSNVKAFISQGTKSLNIQNAAEVAKLEILNMFGQTVCSVAQPDNNISLAQLSEGVYFIKMSLKNGNECTSKVVVK